MDTRTIIMGLAWTGWLLWTAWWGWTGGKTKSNARAETYLESALKYILPLLIALLLLFVPFGAPLDLHWLPASAWLPWAGLVVEWCGLLLACWARLRLGRNWSGLVDLKHDHELIRSGPYAYVRHPIYSGLLLAVVGMVLIIGELRTLLALCIVFATFLYKVRLEERWLGELFGASYANYRRHTRALIPGVF